MAFVITRPCGMIGLEVHPMDEHVRANREMWDALTEINAGSAFYDVEGFKAGRCSIFFAQYNADGSFAWARYAPGGG